jgi:hypothetical protein
LRGRKGGWGEVEHRVDAVVVRIARVNPVVVRGEVRVDEREARRAEIEHDSYSALVRNDVSCDFFIRKRNFAKGK